MIDDRKSFEYSRATLLLPMPAFAPYNKNWSPRRDSNSYKTLTAGAALPLSYAGYPTEAAGRNRTCVNEFRKLAPHPLGHGSEMVETMGLIQNRKSSCSGRDSNSDRALIWCLQGISLPLFQLSYRSSSRSFNPRNHCRP